MPTREQGRTVETTNEARAGETGDGVRWVLTWGTLGVIALFVIVWFGFFHGT